MNTIPAEQARKLLYVLKDQNHPLYDMVSSVITISQFNKLQQIAHSEERIQVQHE